MRSFDPITVETIGNLRSEGSKAGIQIHSCGD